jgi:hypothetical protein
MSIVIITFNVILIMNIFKILSITVIIILNLNMIISIIHLKPKAGAYISLAVDIKRTLQTCKLLNLSNFYNPATVII